MKHKQLPRQALEALSPEMIRRYLTAQGWGLIEEEPRAEVWGLDLPEGRIEALLPADTRLVDYAQQLQVLFNTLSIVEDREPFVILRSVGLAQTDVHQVRLLPEGAAPGTVWLAEGSRAVNGLRDLFVSAAYRATSWLENQQPRPVEPARKSNLVYDFISRRVLLGLTQPGSYILTAEVPLTSPIPEQLTLGSEGRFGGLPLARRVSAAFFEGAASAHAAALYATQNSGDLALFEEETQRGLSANVCEALADLSSNGKLPFELHALWANDLPVEQPGRILSFERETIEYLRSGAEYLRERFGRQGVSIRGFITKLEREPTTAPGTVILLGRPEDELTSRAMRVYVELGAEDYRRAGEAHLNRQELVLQGDLERTGNRWNLVRVQNLTIEEVRD
ncbi:hypothetical protein EES37_07465 [Streptomyces sp. ADI91-18]|uniref:hypothetical protein n=1 Tax=Streptomyces sp. ADI91-18 TaxID=1522755 RepID=UPI000F555EA7|nr:hypothetical protein [Streptomyces sp. ADI91-18]RPK49466.1 hypothetical protein EES37_07465 [Streptomyces sp. ADI91-18]